MASPMPSKVAKIVYRNAVYLFILDIFGQEIKGDLDVLEVDATCSIDP